MAAHSSQALARARVARAHEQVAHLDFVRAVVEATASGVTQTEIARGVGVSQPRVSQLLSSAERAAPSVREGFSGASAYEVCQRYAAGQISREQLVDELVRWPFRPARATDGLDWLTGDMGEWNEQVVPALSEGLIDDETYDAVLTRRTVLDR